MPLEKPYLWKINLGEDGEFAKKPYCAHFCRRSKRAAPISVSQRKTLFHVARNIVAYGADYS